MATIKYDGEISGAAIAAAINVLSGATTISIPYANGMRVLILGAP